MRWLYAITFALLVTISPAAEVDLDSLLVESIGGPAALDTLSNVHAYRADGRIVLNGRSGEFSTYYAVPDMFYFEMRFETVSMAVAFDGRTAWMRDFNGHVSELAGYERTELLRQIYLSSYSYVCDDRMPGSALYEGLVEIEEAVCHEILLIPFDLDTIRVYLDTATALTVLQTSRLDNLETRSRYSDYRWVSGIRLPFRSESKAVGAPIESDLIIDSLRLNAEFDHSIFSPGETTVMDYYFPPDADVVVLKFELTRGHIAVDVKVNGRQSAKFILDSGAAINLIDTELADELGLTDVGSITARGVAGYEKIGLVRLDSLAVGDLVLYNQTIGRFELADMFRAYDQKPKHGLLGYDFLSRFPILIDYDGTRISIFNPENFAPPSGGVEVPFRLTSRAPTIDASVAGVTGSFLIDLGSAFGLILHRRFVERHKLGLSLSDFKDLRGSVAGVGGFLTGKSAVAPTFEFGSLKMDRVPIIIPDGESGLSGSEELAGVIGNELLGRFLVLFDYRNQRLILYPGER